MKKSKFSDSKILSILKQAENGIYTDPHKDCTLYNTEIGAENGRETRGD